MTDLANHLTQELDALWRFGLRLTHNEADAQDLVQRTCVKALENAERYQNRKRLRSWLFKIEYRIWLNVIRSRKTRDEHIRAPWRISAESRDEESIRSDSASIANDSPESAPQLQQVVLAVDSLPEKQRLVVLLVAVDGFSYEETANILDLPVGTIMSRLSRARKALHEHSNFPSDEAASVAHTQSAASDATHLKKRAKVSMISSRRTLQGDVQS